MHDFKKEFKKREDAELYFKKSEEKFKERLLFEKIKDEFSFLVNGKLTAYVNLINCFDAVKKEYYTVEISFFGPIEDEKTIEEMKDCLDIFNGVEIWDML